MAISNKLRIYEINTRIFCDKFDDITPKQLSSIADLGFDAIWLMGAWTIGEGATQISKTISSAFEGSPYAITDYELSPKLGGLDSYKTLRNRAREAGLKVLLDFIPNHMGLDSRWIAPHPEFFIESDPEVRNQDPGEYFLHPSGQVVAHGRDPNFPPWYDTAQLDYSSPALRARQIENLHFISTLADGVRCDMAMMVLRDHVREQWYPHASQQFFDQRMPGEFWGEAINSVRRAAPDFIFLAEAYWGKEPQLCHLGFDLTYEKELYDALVARSDLRVFDRLKLPTQDLKSSLFFLENHDEARAAAVFSPSENVAAMTLLLALPGSVLLHQGQIQGLTEKQPIQLTCPVREEVPNKELEQDYGAILRATSDAVFKEGIFAPFTSRAQNIVSFARHGPSSRAAYFGQIGGTTGQFANTLLDIGPLWQISRATNALKLIDLVGKNSLIITPDHGAVRFVPSALGVRGDSRFCLVRFEPA
ncbi:MAG TPA: alpha-amylase family glycosyl hydrolase [Blastocatellia bacterium]